MLVSLRNRLPLLVCSGLGVFFAALIDSGCSSQVTEMEVSEASRKAWFQKKVDVQPRPRKSSQSAKSSSKGQIRQP
jgi:hypothetical protein